MKLRIFTVKMKNNQLNPNKKHLNKIFSDHQCQRKMNLN